MEPSLVAEFKTLLSEEEYKRLVQKYKGNPVDLQTNHYLDTERFSLKATEASLRVRERDILTLTYKRKKGYNIQDLRLNITSSDIKSFRRNTNNYVCIESISINPDYQNEIIIYLTDKNNVITQDLTIVRHLDNGNKFEVIVFADKDNEDYTDKFEIEIYKFEE